MSEEDARDINNRRRLAQKKTVRVHEEETVDSRNWRR